MVSTSVMQPMRRIPAIDIARGIAVLGMFAYHLTWDLASLGFIARTIPFTSSFRVFSHVVASTFLFLAGASLVLASKQPFAWRIWARHLAIITAAALLVTLASAVLFPDGLIGFGILHCIALALLMATPFLRMPAALSAGAAILIAALPAFIQMPLFNEPWLIWTGLGTVEPSSNDFRPFFPWAAPVFAGLAVTAFVRKHGLLSRLSSSAPTSNVARLFAYGGRHSLAIYLVHQPLFIGVLSAIAFAFPPDRENRAFVDACTVRCLSSGGTSSACAKDCTCVSHEMEALNLRGRAIAGRLDSAEKLVLSQVTQACLRELR